MSHIICFVLYPILLGSSFFPHFASTTTCQVYPSQYAYYDDSVTRTESASANCRMYASGLQLNVFTERYFYCGGTQLKLTDSSLGQEQYQNTDYYVWPAGSDGQLLFIFPIRVSLTTITLHYYSDSVRGRPRLRFYAVPDDFDVWDALTSGTPYVGIAAIPPGGEPAGRRSVSISTNFNTMKVLMNLEFKTNFTFAVSEVEFFRCIPTIIPVTSSTTTAIKDHNASTRDFTTNNTTMKQEISQATTLRSPQTSGALQPTAMVAIGVVGTLFLILITSLIIVSSLIVWYRKRRTRKLEIDPNSAGSMREDASYSILERGARQQIQPQDSNSTELYDQSPSTGQTELISKTESETAEGINTTTPNVYSSVDTENFKPVSNSEESKIEDATYAVVNKKKKKKKSKGLAASDDNANKKGKIKEEVEVHEQPLLEDMYAIIHKKPKKSEEQGETPPPIPAPTVESLYTAVQKTPQ